MDRLKVGNYDNGKPWQLKFVDCPFSEKPDLLWLSQDAHRDRKSRTTANTDAWLVFKTIHTNLIRSWR